MPQLPQIIGPFTFDSLLGEFQRSGEELQIIDRPGVDGSGIRRLGRRGRPFSVHSIRYEAHYNQAELLVLAYKSLQAAGPVIVVKNGIPLNESFQVLDVSKLSIGPCGTSAGTIVPFPTVRMVCEWTLLALAR